MKRDLLKVRISIGGAVIQDIENGIVNIGMSAQRNIVKSEDNSTVSKFQSLKNNELAAVNDDGSGIK